MDTRLYRFDRKTAELLFIFVEAILAFVFVERVMAGKWVAAALFVIPAMAFALVRLVRGPLVGPALLEVTGDKLFWKSFFYFPGKIQSNRLESIRILKIVGPRGDRRFRFTLVDGSEEEFRPHYGQAFELKVVRFLKNVLPKRITLIEEQPPGLLSQIRGDY
jgi:hypothetical protein